MKILVVGYACNPCGGSEPGVGWTAVCRIAKKHDIFVLTDDHNRMGWEKARLENTIPSSVHVRFLRRYKPCSANRFIAHLQSWQSYAAFNRVVLQAACEWHAEVGFDLCHQVTIASWRLPSPLWKLPIPFVWGPIGGGGYIPPAFRSMLSPASRGFEAVRDLNTAMSLRSKAFRDCIRATAMVFAANEETELLIKPMREGRPLVRLPIASISPEKVLAFRRPPEAGQASGPLRLFAGGNMEGRKGVSLALRALARVAATGIDFHYTVAGGGPEIPSLIALSKSLGLDHRVEFHPGFQGEDYIAALHRSHLYFLPSFRESTPVTLLEAYLAGCYPVVADTSAQGEIVRLAGGHAVTLDTIEGLVKGLADAVVWCETHRADLPLLAAQAAETVAHYFASERYDNVIDMSYRTAIERSS